MTTLSYTNNGKVTVSYTDDMNIIQVRNRKSMYIIKDGVVASMFNIKSKFEAKAEHVECKEYIRSDESIERDILKASDMELTEEDYLRETSSSLTSNYDGSAYDSIWEDTDECVIYRKKFGSIKAFDTELRGRFMMGSIKFIELLTYLCTIHEIRDLIYITEYKIKVRKPKEKNYPEMKAIDTISDLMMVAINIEDSTYIRNKFLLLWSAAPEGTIANKAWKTRPSLDYSDMDQVITWQNTKPSYKLDTEEGYDITPATDIDYNSDIYITPYELRLLMTYRKNKPQSTETYTEFDDVEYGEEIERSYKDPSNY